MDDDRTIREQVLALLKGGNAHMTVDEAVKDFPIERINEVFPNGTYSAWGLLEHIRRSQWDILDFISNSEYKERSWPNDYWPEKGKKATKDDWKKTIDMIHKDSEKLQRMLMDKKTDLSAKVPWGDGQTMMREFLLVADHNAYHIGEFAIMRQVMGTWGKGHE